MNSQEEKELFEAWGWEYNYVTRRWVAPNGVEITTDELVEFTVDREGEATLVRLIVQNGRAR